MFSNRSAVLSPFRLLSSRLPSEFDDTIKQLLKFFANGLRGNLDSKNELFDWQAFKRSIDGYPNDTILYDAYKKISRSSKTMSVGDAANQAADFLSNSFRSHVEQKDIQEYVIEALVNLERARREGWASFITGRPATDSSRTPGVDQAAGSSQAIGLISKLKRTILLHPLVEAKASKPETFWELRFSLCNVSPSAPRDLSAVVCTIVIGAPIKGEDDWFRFTHGTCEDFSLDLTGMNILVTNGFKGEP
ncbi:hypothetical protein FRC09_013969 [Ceratobasidium sp. 395]|nr:hypothetical protein FRC09_013969 [Ceratobasidium sp. 395]